MIVLMNANVQADTVYQGRLFNVQTLSWTDAHGRIMQREVVRHPGAVIVIPVLDEGRLVMIRNYRIAVDEVLWEFPAGKLESGENPSHAAHRELVEETGYRASNMTRIGEFFTSPGFADELMRAFVAEGLSFISQRLEPGEDIHVEVVPVEQAMAMIGDGRLRDAKSIASLLMWRQLRAEVVA